MDDLTPAARKFILHWGEMGSRWGINRTVAQVHALLFVSPEPLTADDLVAALGVARSNVSTSLKELQGWGIVRVVHVMGDRRDHFESLADVWELFTVIMDERKKREFDPTVAALADCIDEARRAGPREAHLAERLTALHDFLSSMGGWYGSLRALPRSAAIQALRLGDRVKSLFGFGSSSRSAKASVAPTRQRRN